MFRYFAFLAGALFSKRHPFVNRFRNHVVSDKSSYYIFFNLEESYRNLLKIKDSLPVTDLGAGSRKFKNTNRQVGQIAKISVSSPYKCRTLFRAANYFKTKTILELGTSLGVSAAYLASQNSSCVVHTIEGDKGLMEFASQFHKKLAIDNCRYTVGDFKDVLTETLSLETKWDLIFIDGNHSFQGTIDYVEKIIQMTGDNTVLILDDIYWSFDMFKAWSKIKAMKEVQFTIDMFYFGFVFKRGFKNISGNYYVFPKITYNK